MGKGDLIPDDGRKVSCFTPIQLETSSFQCRAYMCIYAFGWPSIHAHILWLHIETDDPRDTDPATQSRVRDHREMLLVAGSDNDDNGARWCTAISSLAYHIGDATNGRQTGNQAPMRYSTGGDWLSVFRMLLWEKGAMTKYRAQSVYLPSALRARVSKPQQSGWRESWRDGYP